MKVRKPTRLVIDVPPGTDDLVIVHPSGRVHRFQYERLCDEPNEDLKEAAIDAGHRIRFPVPHIRKTLRLTPPAGVGVVELMQATIAYEATGKKARRERVHTEQLAETGDRLVVDMPSDLSTVIVERDGYPLRQVDLDDDREEEEPDPYGWHTITSQIDIPYDVDLVRVDHGPGGGPDDTFKVIHPPKEPAEEGAAAEVVADGAVELVISELAGGMYYRLEFAHPDGEHFTEVDLMDEDTPSTYKRADVQAEGAAAPPRKPKRTSVERKTTARPRRS